jgi:hypothetical protein
MGENGVSTVPSISRTSRAWRFKPSRVATRTIGTDGLRVLAEIDVLTKRQLGVEMLQGNRSPGVSLDQGLLDRGQPVVAAEVALNGGKPADRTPAPHLFCRRARRG